MKEYEFTAKNEIFPLRLRELMIEHGTTQEQLARLLGVRRQTISLYVNGQSKADWTQVAKIARYFQVPADWLLGLSEIKSYNISTQAVEELTGLSEEAIQILNEEKKYTAYKQGLNFLIEDESMLRKLIDYMWSDFYSQLSQGDFRYIPKKQDVMNYMDDILFASLVQNLSVFKKAAFDAHKDNNAVINSVLWDALEKYADFDKCRQIVKDNVTGLEEITPEESHEIELENEFIADMEEEISLEDILTPEEIAVQEHENEILKEKTDEYVAVHMFLKNHFEYGGDNSHEK